MWLVGALGYGLELGIWEFIGSSENEMNNIYWLRGNHKTKNVNTKFVTSSYS